VSIRSQQLTPALLQVEAILSRLRGPQALTEVCRFLRHEFPHYHWVGIYRRDGDALVLDGWDGEAPTEHTRIPLARGVCGRAARENRTVVVGDVQTDPEYLACFVDTRAEVVVPIRHPEGPALGEIDIDGTAVNAFDRTDERFLEQVAEKLVPFVEPDPSAPSGPSS